MLDGWVERGGRLLAGARHDLVGCREGEFIPIVVVVDGRIMLLSHFSSWSWWAVVLVVMVLLGLLVGGGGWDAVSRCNYWQEILESELGPNQSLLPPPIPITYSYLVSGILTQQNAR